MQSIGIPVDNSEFSTFSTGFSTGVIHRGIILWIFIFGSHKMRFRGWKHSVLFRGFFFGRVFYYVRFFVQKFGLDSGQGKGDGTRDFGWQGKTAGEELRFPVPD